MKLSFIGRKFERLTVVASAESDKLNKPRWLCRCDCGTEKIIYEQSLCRGRTISCGCYSKEASSKRMSRGYKKLFTKAFFEREHIDLKKSLREIAKEAGCRVTCVCKYLKYCGLQANDSAHELGGKRFDKLLVLARAKGRGTQSCWHVQCDCGVQKVVSAGELVRHRIVSCGCWNREKCWEGCGDLSKTYWSRLVSEAKRRELEFSLTIEDGWELFLKQNRKCVYTGRVLELDPQYSQNIKNYIWKQTASLDRIDSVKGYTLDNVQWVHVKINRMKWDMSEDVFVQFCKEVAENSC